MANFSTLFPNLQSDLDFVDVAGLTGNGSANSIANWAQSDDTTVIPPSKLPNLMAGQVYTGTATAAATSDLALTAWVTAFNAATAAVAGTNDGITVAAGSQISPGDTLIITDSTGDTETYVFVGTQTTVPANLAGTNATNFRDISHAGDVVDTLGTTGSTGNIVIGGTAAGSVFVGQATVTLDSTLTGITSVTNATGAAIGIGQSDAVTNINGLTTAITGGSAGRITNTAPEFDVTASSADSNAIHLAAASGGVQIDANNYTVGTFAVGNTSANVNVQYNALSYNVASSGVNFSNAEGATAGFNVNSTGNTSIGGNFSSFSGTGQTTIGVNTSGTFIASDSITGTGTTAAAAAPIGVLASGEIVTGVSVGGGAQKVDGTTETATTTGETADVNAVYFIAPKTIAAYTLNLPAAGTAGNWIKIVNRSNFKAGNVVKDPAVATGADLKTTVTLSTATGQIVGNGTDSTFVMNDTTANFEMISDGTNWNIIAS